jgi:benzoyl-CoA reductase subunit D
MSEVAGAATFLSAALAGCGMGALHARAIRMDAGARVLGHRMTRQCASGTGQFLENVARYLGVPLEAVAGVIGAAFLGALRYRQLAERGALAQAG